MPQLHMPLQSGSDAVLRAMRRAYRRDRYLAILDRVRAAHPAARRSPPTSSSASPARPRRTSRTPWTWSARPGSPPRSPSSTRSARAPRPRPCRPRCRGPWCRSVTSGSLPSSSRSPTEENAKQNGTVVEVLVAEGEGRKDAATHRMSGRARDNRLVHFTPHGTTPRPGDIVTTRVTRAAPHYLLADARPADRPPHPRGRRLGGPPRRRHPPRPPLPLPTRFPSCSACPPAGQSRIPEQGSSYLPWRLCRKSMRPAKYTAWSSYMARWLPSGQYR